MVTLQKSAHWSDPAHTQSNQMYRDMVHEDHAYISASQPLADTYDLFIENQHEAIIGHLETIACSDSIVYYSKEAEDQYIEETRQALESLVFENFRLRYLKSRYAHNG